MGRFYEKGENKMAAKQGLSAKAAAETIPSRSLSNNCPFIVREHFPSMCLIQPFTANCIIGDEVMYNTIVNQPERAQSYNYWARMCPCEARMVTNELQTLFEAHNGTRFLGERAGIVEERHHVDLVTVGLSSLAIGCNTVGGVPSYYVCIFPSADGLADAFVDGPAKYIADGYYFQLPSIAREFNAFMEILRNKILQMPPCRVLHVREIIHKCDHHGLEEKKKKKMGQPLTRPRKKGGKATSSKLVDTIKIEASEAGDGKTIRGESSSATSEN